jgi:hypothetical protein
MVKARVLYLSMAILVLLGGCAGKLQYTPPIGVPSSQNSVTINMSKSDLWKTIVPSLGKSFFVINNLDKDSGIINVSYSGDPESYVDCGEVNSYVKNAQGERTYVFPASRANQTYEIMDMKHGYGLVFVDRRMNLEGRINIIIEEISSEKTQITVNTKYVLTKSGTVRGAGGQSGHFSDTISFVSPHQGKFPRGPGGGTICQPNGRLEQEILAILTKNTK